MTNDFPHWLEAIVAILGVFGVVGGAVAYFGQNRAKTIIDLQQKELVIVRETNTRLVAELKTKEVERGFLVEKITGLERQLEYLRTIVTAAPQIAKLSEDLVKQHQEVVSGLTRIATLLEDNQNATNK